MTLKKSLSTILICSSIFGCAIPTKQGADIVEVVYIKPAKDMCQYIGQTSASDGGMVSGQFMSDEKIYQNTENILKNKAYEMGGDLVYVQQQFNKNKHITKIMTNQTMQGFVYHCQGYD